MKHGLVLGYLPTDTQNICSSKQSNETSFAVR